MYNFNFDYEPSMEDDYRFYKAGDSSPSDRTVSFLYFCCCVPVN